MFVDISLFTFIQYAATALALVAILWVIAGLIVGVFEPDEEYQDELEEEYPPPKAPGLPHNRRNK